MDIKFLNKDTVHIKTKEVSILLNPANADLKACKANIAIQAIDNADLSGADCLVFDWPGEYEAKNVLVKSIAVKNQDKSEVRIVTMEIDGLNTAYIGHLDHVPSNKQLFEELSIVEVLIINPCLPHKQLLEIIEEVEPRVVVIAENQELKDAEGLAEVDKLRKEIGKLDVETEEKTTIKISADDLDSQIEYRFVTAG